MAFANISLQAVENALVEARTTDGMAKKVEALTRGLESVVRHIEDQKRDNAHAVRQLKSSLGSSLPNRSVSFRRTQLGPHES